MWDVVSWSFWWEHKSPRPSRGLTRNLEQIPWATRTHALAEEKRKQAVSLVFNFDKPNALNWRYWEEAFLASCWEISAQIVFADDICREGWNLHYKMLLEDELEEVTTYFKHFFYSIYFMDEDWRNTVFHDFVNQKDYEGELWVLMYKFMQEIDVKADDVDNPDIEAEIGLNKYLSDLLNNILIWFKKLKSEKWRDMYWWLEEHAGAFLVCMPKCSQVNALLWEAYGYMYREKYIHDICGAENEI